MNLGALPDSDSDELLKGCRKQSNVNHYFDRTAGVAAMVRPCGIVVNFSEMFSCESPTQMYIFLVFTLAHGKDIDRLKFVAYDRACDLHPFLCNLDKKGLTLLVFFLNMLNSVWTGFMSVDIQNHAVSLHLQITQIVNTILTTLIFLLFVLQTQNVLNNASGGLISTRTF